MKQTIIQLLKLSFSTQSWRKTGGMAISLALATIGLTSCFSDDTTLAERELSEIVIDQNSMKEVYNINKNETLVITPVFSQTQAQLDVKTTWEIDQKVYSNEPSLSFTGKELGSWNCRLILENEDGRTFYPFRLNVNSPYEEGITIISADNDGRPWLSFMAADENGNDTQFYDYDCLSVNNSDIQFASHPADMVQSAGSLILVCQGNGTSADVPTLYYVQEKTMTGENMLTVTEYPDFKPTILGIPSMDASGVAYPVLCENGKTYEFSTTEGALVKPTKLKYTYAQNMIVHDNGSGYSYELLAWDSEIGALAQIYNGYGPYYCSKNYHQTRATCTGQNNYFDGREFCNMTYVRMTDEQLAAGGDPQVLVIVKNGQLVQKVILSTSFWKYNFDTAETVLSDNGGTKVAAVGACPLTATTPAIANMTYYSLLFADGNKVRRWNYTTSQLLTNADVLQTIGSADAVITGFEMSADHKKTYVAFYEPSQTGKNGSLWVIDTDRGTILQKYDNISYRPVKMIYKKK